MKLRRAYEAAAEEGKPVEEVALERFGSLEAFEEAKEERRVLDEREGKRSARGDRDRGRDNGPGRGRESERRYMFTDVGSAGSSRSASFRRPGESTPSTPSPATSGVPANKRLDTLRMPPKGSPLSMSHTPVPSVMTPPPLNASGSGGKKRLTTEELNRLQARVLRAKLMGAPDAEEPEKEYEVEQRRAAAGDYEVVRGNEDEGQTRTRLEVLPTLDSRGQLYDVGTGRDDMHVRERAGNKRRKEAKYETRDPKTGELVRVNADDDEVTLGDMLRAERFGAGMADQKNMDAELAAQITRDSGFQDNLDYVDDNAERLGRKKMRSDGMKRQFAINGMWCD